MGSLTPSRPDSLTRRILLTDLREAQNHLYRILHEVLVGQVYVISPPGIPVAELRTRENRKRTARSSSRAMESESRQNRKST